jgi:hypothetical protein
MEDIQKIKEFFSKPLNEGSTTFKVGDKVTYLGHPAVITAVNKEMTGDITYNVYYDKGQGKTKVTNIFNKGGDIKPLEEDFGQALFNRLNPKDEDLEAIVNILIQDPKIRKSPDQASFKEALENYIRFNSDRNSIGQAAVRALSYRNTGGRYGSGFDKIFNMLVDKNNLSKSLEESLTGGYPYKKTSGGDFERIDIAEPMDNATRNKMIKNFRAAGWDAKPSNRGGIVAIKRAIMEAKEEDVVDTITMDVPLFIRMLEYSREDAAEDMDLHDVTEKAIALNKEKSILSMDDYDAIVGGAEEIQENKIKELAEAVFAKLKK